MKNILVPTDFSATAENALRVAVDIARRQSDIRIHLVHAYERPVSGFALQFEVDKSLLKRIHDAASLELQKLVSQSWLEGVEVISHLVPDKRPWELAQVSSLAEMDMIVMGTHGVSGVKETFIGSNTQKVVQTAQVPVLAVKSYNGPFNVENMTFASDFKDEAMGSFHRIKNMADILGARMHLVRVNTPNSFSTTSDSEYLMEGFAKQFQLQDYTVNEINAIDVESGIHEFADRVDADLIAMETHGRTGLGHLLNPSIAEHVVNHDPRPVLSMRVQKELTRDPLPETSQSKNMAQALSHGMAGA